MATKDDEHAVSVETQGPARHINVISPQATSAIGLGKVTVGLGNPQGFRSVPVSPNA